MHNRARKMDRILAVQEQLHSIEKWRLVELQRTLEALDEAQKDLIQALNEDDALQGLFIDATARRLRSLAEEADRLDSEIDAQSARLREHAAQLVLAKRLSLAANRDLARSNSKRQLLDIIERFAGAMTQASGKIVEG